MNKKLEVLKRHIDEKNALHVILGCRGKNGKVSRIAKNLLVYCINTKNFDMLDVLLPIGAPVNFYVYEIDTLLTMILNGRMDVETKTKFVHALLEAGADPNLPQKRTGKTPLMLAVQKHVTPCIEMLIEKGANVDAQGLYGVSALIYAIDFGNVQAIDMLLDAGADINLTTHMGETALMHGVRVPSNCPQLARLLGPKENLSRRNKHGYTALHQTAGWGNSFAVQLLIEAGADLNAQNHDGDTPLHLSAHYGTLQCTNLLIDAGADLNIKTFTTGCTPLMECIEANRVKHFDLLVSMGADLNVQDDGGQTALIRAITSVRKEIFIKKLIDAGADLNIQDNQGFTALMHAVLRCKGDVVRWLLEAGASVHIRNTCGVSALDIASANLPKKDPIVKMLMGAS